MGGPDRELIPLDRSATKQADLRRTHATAPIPGEHNDNNL